MGSCVPTWPRGRVLELVMAGVFESKHKYSNKTKQAARDDQWTLPSPPLNAALNSVEDPKSD